MLKMQSPPPETTDIQTIQSPNVDVDDNNASEQSQPANEEPEPPSSPSVPRRHSFVDIDEPLVQENPPQGDDEDVDMYEDLQVQTTSPLKDTATSPPREEDDVVVDTTDTPSSPVDESSNNAEVPSQSPPPPPIVYANKSPSPSQNEDSVLSKKDEDDDGPQSPEDQQDTSQQSNGVVRSPVVSYEEESQSQSQTQSQPSPSPPPPSKKEVVDKQESQDEVEEGEDLEDGEIMDEEEPEEGEEPKPKKDSEKKSKDPEKEKKKRDVEDDDNDPVKRLLAEVREKDNRERREERERRRQEKKRAHKEEKEKEKESKSKRRKTSGGDDEQEGEYLFVRGASPGGAGGDENWEDEGHRKKRRDSDEGHRHNRRAPDGGASPSRPARMERPKRPERREPKSDVICAYFMQGKCQKSAEQCNFSHDAIPPRKMELCKFWMMECCAKKEKCLYLHNDFPCKFFHTGLVCRMADKCKFSHDPLSEGTKQVLLKHIETAPKEILGDFPRLNRTGALNLINKMEAKLKGLPYDEEENNENDNMMNHSNHGHGQDRHGPQERHGGPDRHQDRYHNNNDRGRDNRGHFGGPGHHDNSRGRGHDRGGDRGAGGLDGHHDRRQSRWEQSQPTRGDQEKLQELMNEAGISGYYKDTMGDAQSNQRSTGQTSTAQGQGLLPGMQNIQPSLLPLIPGFMPGMLPQPINNPALANVLAHMQISSSTIVPPNASQFPASGNNLDDQKPDMSKPPPTDSGSSIPGNLPKMQQDLFKRIQAQQEKNQNKVQTAVKSEPDEPEENWYSDEEEDDPKKKEELKAEINDQISSVLNQIRQQSQQQQAASTKEPEGLKTFFGDTDLRSSTLSTQSPSDFKDVDLRTSSSSIFKKVNILPATEINASLSSHTPVNYKVWVVAGLRERPDYSQIRHTLTQQAILLDPRLGPKKRNSIPAPESPTDQMSEGLSQPMSIPAVTPVFDPRTAKGGPPPSQGRGLLDTPNPFDQPSIPGMHMNLNDFNNPFSRDPRGQGGNVAPQVPTNPAAAAQMAQMLMQMQQQWPSGQAPIDPNLLMLGLPFLAQAQGAAGQASNPGMDFSMMQNPGMRMRPPFMQGNSAQSPPQPPASSWERFNRGQGNLSPPL